MSTVLGYSAKCFECDWKCIKVNKVGALKELNSYERKAPRGEEWL